jgi:hypothetical protein
MARRFPPSTRLGAFIILPHQNRRACGILALVAAIARRTNVQPYLLPCEADKGKAGNPGNWRNSWVNLIKKRQGLSWLCREFQRWKIAFTPVGT